jgi:excisionase family DNA binding protein
VKGWFRTNQGAEYAGVSPRKFRDMLKDGLTHSRLGGCILIHQDDIDAYIRAHAVDVNEIDRLADEAVAEFKL